MFTPAHPLHCPPTPQRQQPMMRTHAAPVIHDRWGEDVSVHTPAAAPLVVTQVLTATGERATLNASGCGAVAVQLAGQWRGRVRFETSDDGVAWQPLTLVAHRTGERATSATKPGLWYASGSTTGRHIRLHVSALLAGAVVGCLAAVSAPPQVAERVIAPVMRHERAVRQRDDSISACMR